MPAEVRAAYARAVATLLDLSPEGSDSGEPMPRVLEFTDHARAVLIGFKEGLEPRLGPAGDLNTIVDWGNKLSGTVARIAALLHIAEHAGADAAAMLSPVPATAVLSAVVIAGYLVEHARAAFAVMGADPATEDAQHVLAWLRRDGRARLSKREIHRGVHSRVRTAADLDKLLGILEERGYVRQVPPERAGRGRPSSSLYEVRPADFGDSGDRTTADSPN